MVDRVPVSVVIPAYNGQDFIGEAIQSVHAQTLPVSEIIVVDNGSTDETSKVAESLGATVIQQSNSGVAAARNTGIRAASSPWVALLDQDDIWEPEKIEYQWAALQLHADAGLASCNMTWFEVKDIEGRSTVITGDMSDNPVPAERGETEVGYFPKVPYELLSGRVYDKPSSVLIRRDLFLSIGGFDESLRQNEDLDCFLRLVARSPFVVVERRLVRRRIHDRNNSHHNYSEAGMSFLKIVSQMSTQPERYPPGSAQAYHEDAWRVMIQVGRLRLNEGRSHEARLLFAGSLKKIYSNRAVFLWCLTFLGPSARKYLLTLMRKLSKDTVGTIFQGSDSESFNNK